MAEATRPGPLPEPIRPLIEGALAGALDRLEAIEAIEAYLADGGDRHPEVLVALATLTYEDAATLVLSRLGAASEVALRLVEEAIAAGGDSEELLGLRAAFQRTLREERARERRLRDLLARPDRRRPAALAELAHRILMSGEDDGLAFDLMAEAAEDASLPSDAPPARASNS